MQPPASSAHDEMRFRERMAKVGASTGPSKSPRRKDEADDEKARGFHLGWFVWLLIDTAIVFGTVAAVLAWPALDACRTQDKSVGFYAGESVGNCVRRGIYQRIGNADQQIKMLLRNSGR